MSCHFSHFLLLASLVYHSCLLILDNHVIGQGQGHCKHLVQSAMDLAHSTSLSPHFPILSMRPTRKVLGTIFEIISCRVGWGLREKQQWLSAFENFAK